MSIHTLQDLAYAYGVAEPVREMLFALQDRITELEAKRTPLTNEEIGKAWSVADGEHNASAAVKRRITRAIEAAHGIKEGT